SLIESVEQFEAKPSSGDIDPQGLAAQIETIGHRRSPEAARELEQLLDALGDLHSAGARAEPPVLEVAQIRAFLDDSTLLLAYHLGNQKSHVFTIDARGLEVAELPPATEIEAQIRRLIELAPSHLAESRAAFSLAVDRVSTLLLAPVAHRLASVHRLV